MEALTFSWGREMRWAWRLSKGYRARLFIYLAAELAAIVFSLLFVYYSKKAVDVALNAAPGSLRYYTILVISCIFAGLALRTFSGWLNQMVQLHMLAALKQQVLQRQMLSVWQAVKNFHTGDVLVRINDDSADVVQMIAYDGLAFIVTVMRLAASFIFLWSIDPLLAWMLVAITPLLFFSKIYYKKMRRLARMAKMADSAVGNIMQENLRMRLLIRSLGIAPLRQGRLGGAFNAAIAVKQQQLNFNLLTQGVLKVAINAGYLLAFIWGIYRLHLHQISFGTMTAFLQLVSRIQGPMLAIIAFVPAFIKFKSALERLYELNTAAIEDQHDVINLPDPQEILLRDISFAYENEVPVIQRFNATIRAGRPVAVMGLSGTGKTTVIRLLLGLITPAQGHISVTDGELGKLPLTSAMRQNFAYVPQGNTLFTGTVLENLKMNRQVSDLEINEALKAACADFVHGLPLGLNTLVGEGGMGLSEGQAQRIAIARALLSGGKILMLDEATSALDDATRDMVTNAIISDNRNRIIMFVTHDAALAAKCNDKIVIN